MKAIEKIEALTFKRLHELVEPLKPGIALETLYRWRAALKDGRGVSDAVKTVLIAATRETEHPIAFADFAPEVVA